MLLACLVLLKGLLHPSVRGHVNRMQRDAEIRLVELDALHSQGRASADGYAEQRWRIMESI